MRVSNRVAQQLVEAMDATGIPRREVLAALELDAAALADSRGQTEWDTFVAILEQGWSMVGHDPARMRDVGAAIARAPSYVFLQRLARTVVSVRSLYEGATRWGAHANFPHCRVSLSRLSDRRLRWVATVPEPYVSSIAFLHVFEGVLTETPRLLGLEPSTIVSSTVTERHIDVVLELPDSPSLFGRARRMLRAALFSGDVVDLLEGQRRELEEGLEEVKRSSSEIQEVFDHLPVLVIIHRDGAILWSNHAVATALGHDGREALIGRTLFDVVERGAHELVRKRMQAPASTTPELTEVPLVRSDGTILLTEVFPTQVVRFDGKPARMIVARDATERMRLQQQLLISARMASIGMLAAGVAHEVNNPLAYVLNNVEIARKGLATLGEPAEQSRQALGVALEGVDRIRTIVRDLLALSRVDDVAIGPVDVLAVVDSTLALARKEIAERAELVFEPEPVPLACGTVARLGQVLLNLIANALESLPPSARADNLLRVTVRRSSSGGAVVEVTDNGIGIPPEHRAHIFDPFFTTKPPGSGTGLGLAISQRLVAEMGGQLSFESTPNRGSTFRVTLPPADAEDAEDADERAAVSEARPSP